jgi:hypothetical protein
VIEIAVAGLAVAVLLQSALIAWIIYRVEHDTVQTDPVIDAIYQDALKTLAEYRIDRPRESDDPA